MIAFPTTECAYCRSSSQRWVRQKIYDPTFTWREPRYHRYHAEPFAGEDESCWEKHQMQQELARTAAYAA